MSDRIVLMRGGRIVQQGTAQELYDRPQSLFVARFFSHLNELEGMVLSGRAITRDRLVLRCRGARGSGRHRRDPPTRRATSVAGRDGRRPAGAHRIPALSRRDRAFRCGGGGRGVPISWPKPALHPDSSQARKCASASIRATCWSSRIATERAIDATGTICDSPLRRGEGTKADEEFRRPPWVVFQSGTGSS